MKPEINVWVVLSILFCHWVFDFVLQTDKQAKGKSKNWDDLLAHTRTYSIGFLVVALMYGGWDFGFLFFMVTFLCHTVQDYFTSRVNSILYAKGRIHDFFVSLSFDQFLHFAQLLLTFQLLQPLIK